MDIQTLNGRVQMEVKELELTKLDTKEFIEEKVREGHLGAKTSKGIYDYGGLTEQQILKKRDKLYLEMLDHMEKIKAFDPV